ncbi:MAG: hypothetical protein IPJ08_01925 [Burkholderiales bacterium]|nr:hypothetical protein [Burkholderiales bacterium]
MTRTVRIAALALGLATLFSAGCASRWEQPTEQDGSWCYWFGRGQAKQRTQTCTPHPVPDLQTDLQAKTFTPAADAVTVYVVRRSMDDYRYRVPVLVDGTHSVDTIPGSYVRLKLQPGAHKLSIAWRGQVSEQTIAGNAGDIRLLQVAGLSTDQDSQFSWSDKTADDTRQRVLKAKLIRDLDLR